MMKLSSQAALDLAGRFYDAALDPAKWEPAISRLMTAFRGNVGAFVQATRQAPPVILREIHVGLAPTPDQLERYGALQGQDPRVAWAFRNLGRAGASNLEIDPQVMRGSAMYTELLREVDIEYTLMLPELVDERTVVSLSVTRGKASPPFDRHDVAALQALRPHLLRALRIQGRLGETELLVHDLREALDRLPIGVVLLDEAGRALFVSQAAERAFDNDDGFRLADGGLEADHLGAARRLRTLLDQAVAAARSELLPTEDTMTIPRSSGRPPYEILVAPLRADRLGVWPGRPAAMLIVHDPGTTAELPADLVQRLYGLSPAEARLSAALASGWSLKDYSVRTAISVETARSQLKSAMSKTGTHRQAELIRVLLRGPAAYALLQPEALASPTDAFEATEDVPDRPANGAAEPPAASARTG